MQTTLLVEDAAFFEKAIVKKLHEVGRNQIMVARNYAEAESCLDLPIGEPDLALVDLTLPDAPDGEIVELCRQRGIPTIVFTSRLDPKVRAKMLDHGVIDYVLKDSPGSLDYVADLIRKLAQNPKIGVLVLDDAPVELDAIAQIVSKHLYKVYKARSSKEALETLKTHPDIKLVLSDYFMPEQDGFAFLKEVRRRHSRDQVVVIGMSSFANPDNRVRFLKYGAADFVDKNCSPEELLLRISQNLEFIYRIEELNNMAMRDFLTGLYNRRFLFDTAAPQMKGWQDEGDSGNWLALFDLDSFKEINDELGHDYGDAVLVNFATHLKKMSNQADYIIRLGGDEFCAILRNRTEAEVTDLLSNFLEQIDKTHVRCNGKMLQIKTSIGTARIEKGNLADSLRNADMRLYSAKRAGRGRLVSSG
ncbi:diguanylate cyclase [Roseibium denhamense]|uniref:diguanylate cyclase n=1 Tax=Roseibium denhamense TaxID=76305 RepID=A0ABY1NUB2_9HYPH|nr:diguanylate cyclase [Roseibium denhamense]MTI05470.1 diguanylate cyclase [Roseibium denhamense]SMP18500.1 response regulator receiver modulated diguanylate cyclase [Roseibium denhamense]